MTWPTGAPAFTSPLPFLAAFGAAFFVYWQAAVRGRVRWSWPAVAAFGLLARLCLLPLPPSDDLARYLWEGRLLLLGANPYILPPDHASLEAYRDAAWEAINHKDIPAIYPPLALGFFAAVTKVAPSVTGFKLAFILLDLLALGLLAMALRAGGARAGDGEPADAASDARVGAAYFLNPLLILETAGHGHYEALPLLLSLAFLWALRAGRALPAAGLLALAVGAKVAALVLLPLLVLRFRGARGWLSAAAAAGAAALLLAPGAANLGRFAGDFRYNDAVPFVLRSLLGGVLDPGALRVLTLGMLALAGLFAARRLRKAAPEVQGLAFLALVLAFSPTVHPWYALWLLPFACLAAALPAGQAPGGVPAGPGSSLARPALLLTGTLAVAYLVHARAYATGAWRELPWLRLPEYLPPLLLWAWEARAARRGAAEEGRKPA